MAPIRPAAQAIQMGQHLLLAFITASAMVSVSVRGAWTVLLGGTMAAFIGWYLVGILLARRQETPSARQSRVSWQGVLWLAVLIGLWAGLVAQSRAFVWISFSLMLLSLILLPGWAGVPAVVGLTAFTGWTQWWSGPPPDPMNSIAGPSMGGLVALGVAWGYRTIVRESSERARLITQLTATRDDLVAVQDTLAASQREAGIASERARIARDIHDTLAQGFSSILLLARAGRRDGAAARDRDLFDQISQTAQENLDESRRVVMALTPEGLEQAGLADAIGRQLQRLRDQTGIAVHLRIDGAPAPLPTTAEVALLRFVQGALANARTHSSAGMVHVTMTYEPEEVRVDVVDDGVGFDTTAVGPREDGTGFGLGAMRDRLAAVGAHLTVESSPGEGTALVATMPRGRLQ